MLPKRVHPSATLIAPRLTVGAIAILWTALHIIFSSGKSPTTQWTPWEVVWMVLQVCCVYGILLYSRNFQLLFGWLLAALTVSLGLQNVGLAVSTGGHSPLLLRVMLVLLAVTAYLVLWHKPMRIYRRALDEFDVLPPPRKLSGEDGT
jgi:hypothetical protein